MFLAGHLAAAGLLAAGAQVARGKEVSARWVLLPALVGGITPDLIDKPLQLMGVFASSRSVGHSLVVLAGLVLVWLAVRGVVKVLGRPGRWPERAAGALGFWVLGIFSHHVADFADDVVRGLIRRSGAVSGRSFWPLSGPESGRIPLPDLPRWPPEWPVWPWTVTPLEALVVAAAGVCAGIWLGRRDRRRVEGR